MLLLARSGLGRLRCQGLALLPFRWLCMAVHRLARYRDCVVDHKAYWAVDRPVRQLM